MLTFRVLSSFPDDVEKQYKTRSSPTQYINSPRGLTQALTKSPPSRLPLEKDLTICPCMFIITTVFERLHTTKCSGLRGRGWILFTVKSAAPNDLYVPMHSVVFRLQSFTVPSDEALITLWPSGAKTTSLTKETCPLNSFRVFPDFSPCILRHKISEIFEQIRSFYGQSIIHLIVVSKDADSIWLLSLLNCRQVTPLACAFSNLLRHWPLWTRQTFIFPSWPPPASISLSRLKDIESTACSIIMKLSCAWYFRSFRIFPVVKFQTSINPSTEPVTKYCPSGENLAHSTWDFWPNLICLDNWVGYFSSSWSLTAAFPRNKSIVVPGGRRPWCCCHFRAWPRRASNLLDGTTETSPANAVAMWALRFSFVLPSGYASLGSKYERARRFSVDREYQDSQWIDS